jgi:hypothetical protein
MNWAAKLENLHDDSANKPTGEGWFTVADFKEETGFGLGKCYKLINQSITKGKIEMHSGSEYSESQKQLVRRNWYRFIQPN